MAQAQPLPPLQPVEDMGPLDLMLAVASGATNATSPDAVIGAAHVSANPTEAATNAKAITMYGTAAQAKSFLEAQSGGKQDQIWDQFSPTQQQAVKATGYKPPGGEGLLGEIGGAVAGGWNDFWNAAGSPLRAVQHAERTVSVKLMTNADWADAWDETSKGQSYILPSVQKRATQQWGDETTTLALKLARGQSMQEILQGVPPAQQQQVGQALSSAQVQQATAFLNTGHVSIGEQLANLVLGNHPGELHNLISGSLDAAADWWGDPVNWVPGFAALKFSQAFGDLRYAVTTGDDVENLYNRYSNVRQGFGKLAGQVSGIIEGRHMAAFNAVEGQRTADKGIGLVDKLVQARADTSEKVKDWFKEQADTGALAEGRGTRPDSAYTLPHISPVGALRGRAHAFLTKVTDFGEDGPINFSVDDESKGVTPLNQGMSANRFAVGFSRSVRHLFRTMPTALTFQADGPRALENLRDILSLTFSPSRSDDIIRQFALADLGGRKRIYQSAIKSMAQSMGMQEGTPEFDRAVGRIVATSDRYFAKEDEVFVNGQKSHEGLSKSDMNNTWLVPSPKDFAIGARKVAVQKMAYGINAPLIDKLMGYWRPLTLARLGFATRVGGEEALGLILRAGPLAYIKSQAARLDAKYTARQGQEAAMAAHPVALGAKQIAGEDHGILYKMLRHNLTDEEAASAPNILGLFTRSMAKRIGSAMEFTGHALTTDEYRQAMEEFVARGALEDGPLADILAGHRLGYQDKLTDLSDIKKAATEGDTPYYNGELQATGAFKKYRSGENLHTQMYQMQLTRMANDEWDRLALDTHISTEERRQNLANWLMNDEDWNMSVRSTQTADERLVETGDATRREAAEDHAAKLVKRAERMLRSPKTGKYLRIQTADGETRLADYLLHYRKAPPWYASQELKAQGRVEQLSHIRPEDLPKDVAGPELVPGVGHWNVMRLTDKMFANVIEPQINWLSRQPLAFHNYVMARRAYKGWANHQRLLGMSEEQLGDLLHEHATRRAFNESIGYIHNPELKSQFNHVTRNLMPFQFAKEQFYKRWARTFVYSPSALRRLQLISSGLSNSGFVHTNPEDGSEYFVYPLSAAGMNVVTNVLSKFGLDVKMPVHADLIGNVASMNPGLQGGFLPNFGPVVTIGLDGLKMIDPHFSAAVDGLQGAGSQSSNFLSSVMPTTVMRILDATIPETADASQWASAQMSAIQYMEATGNGIGFPGETKVGVGPPPAGGKGYLPGDYFDDNGVTYVMQPDGHWQQNDMTNPSYLQHYLARLQNWTRVFFVLRAVYGFSGPAAPEDYFDPKGYSAELQTLMNAMPYQQATAAFMAMHPDATAMTVFQTTNEVDGFLPATKKAMSFLDENPKLLKDFPLASTYFIPAPDSKGKFDLAAYQEQLHRGLRIRRTPEEYLKEVIYQQSANDYFAVDNYKNLLLANKTQPANNVYQQWTQFSEAFLKANPVFAEMYTGQGAVTRSEVMAQIGGALAAKVLPDSPQRFDVQTLYDSYVTWQDETANYGQPNAPSASRAAPINADFAQWVANFEATHPDVVPLVQRVIRPALTTTLTDLAARGVALQL